MNDFNNLDLVCPFHPDTMAKMRVQAVLIILMSLLVGLTSQAAESDKPLWEYGFGAGYVRYSDYPAADQYSELILPFPTFQYRGEVLRADDRDGGRAYLFKDKQWSLEFSGSGRLPLTSSKNRAREGMDNLPLVIDGGPQLVYSVNHTWEFQLAPFVSTAIDGTFVRNNGGYFKAQAVYRWSDTWEGPFSSPLTLDGTLQFTINSASQEYNRTYFEVDKQHATASRPSYNAVAGFLSNNISYFQRFSSGRISFYVAGSLTDYSWSVNRNSPLHKADTNFGYGIGLIYVLGESARKSVPLEDTEGIINKVQQHHRERLIPFE